MIVDSIVFIILVIGLGTFFIHKKYEDLTIAVVSSVAGLFIVIVIANALIYIIEIEIAPLKTTEVNQETITLAAINNETNATTYLQVQNGEQPEYLYMISEDQGNKIEIISSEDVRIKEYDELDEPYLEIKDVEVENYFARLIMAVEAYKEEYVFHIPKGTLATTVKFEDGSATK